MLTIRLPAVLPAALFLVLSVGPAAEGAKVTVDLGGAQGVTFVGALNRWDMDGNHRRPVNPKAKIDAPEVDAVANDAGRGRWVFADLPPGNYDLVIMAQGQVRIEGWTYAPVLEFDPFYAPDTTIDKDTAEWIGDDIKKARHYENKVVPLAIGGDEKVARVLMMLIRDKKTSYEGHFPGAATMRFEIWQYDWQYGGWVKNKRTKVLHRVILHRDELRAWTWLWDPKLGGIEVGGTPLTVEYRMPKPSDSAIKGLRPYN